MTTQTAIAARATDTIETLRALYRDALNGNPEAREIVRSGDAYTRSYALYTLASRECAEKVGRAFQRLADILNLDQRREETARTRAAFEAGDYRAFLDAVCASRRGAHGCNKDGDLWAIAMTLCYQDSDAYGIARCMEHAPRHIAYQESDTERWAQDRGLLCRIEDKEIHLYHARQAALQAERVAAYEAERRAA